MYMHKECTEKQLLFKAKNPLVVFNIKRFLKAYVSYF